MVVPDTLVNPQKNKKHTIAFARGKAILPA
jgi:hypothetical protein